MYRKIETLRTACNRCRTCPLCETRTKVVFGEGCQPADILFVGEAPGAREDEAGQPFIGRSGQLMTRMMEEAGIPRASVYITSVVKCRPPENRDPSLRELDLCQHWLEEQIRLLNPKIIVCIGRISAGRLIFKNFKVSKDHGRFFQKNGRILVGLYHPAALLRTPSLKEVAQADYLRLKSFLDGATPPDGIVKLV